MRFHDRDLVIPERWPGREFTSSLVPGQFFSDFVGVGMVQVV
jgi:hypothetical protein